MNRINAEHLSRGAVVYIRQSTADQVQHNLESQRRQYALADRARELGWNEVVVIDDDLGRSGSGVHRPGFERLLAQLCQGEVGAVFCIEASRLARNGRDWHTLLEFCRLVNALLIDEDGIYDPRSANDRLLLGMKGTISEMELSTLRERCQAGLEHKARRGALFTLVPIGFVRAEADRVEARSGSARARGDCSGVSAIPGTGHSASSAHVVAPGAHRAAGEQLQLEWMAQGVEAADLQHRAQDSDQPRLRWRIRVRAHQIDRAHRRGSQANLQGTEGRPKRLGRLAQRPSRGLH